MIFFPFTIDVFLNIQVEVLYTETDAVETDFKEFIQVSFIDIFPWVDFDGAFCVVSESNGFVEMVNVVCQLVGGKNKWVSRRRKPPDAFPVWDRWF